MPFHYKIQCPASIYFSFENSTSFINAFYEVRDVYLLKSKIKETIKKILIIGPGLGISVGIFKHLDFKVTTLDIDPELKPDFLGSVDNMYFFQNKQFDVVICSHVLEHLPFEYFEKSLQEIQRVAKYAIIYLPIAGLKISFKIGLPKIKDKYINIYFPLFLFKTHKFDGVHYWEINTRGHSKKKIREILKKYFEIIKEYHNPEWNYSYNFILSAKNIN